MTVGLNRHLRTMVAASLRPVAKDRDRWADIAVSDDDLEDHEEVNSIPLAVDDSYQEAPLASLEDSKSGLNLDFATRRLESGPKDFDFLMKAKKTQENADDSWTPNLEAPEFIPAFTVVCPLVEACLLAHEAPHLTVFEVPSPSKGRRVAHSSLEANLTPEKTIDFSRPFADAMSSSGGRPDRKRRPPPLFQIQAPSQKTTKRQERQVAAFAVRQRLQSDAMSESCSVVHSEATEATEEEWEHRAEMRAKSIALCKQAPEYQRFAEHRKQRNREADEPSTPNPTDRSISKRQWKHNLQQWRNSFGAERWQPPVVSEGIQACS